MINYDAGDIILVKFSFTEKPEFKKRPALIVSSKEYHKNRQEIIIIAITSNIKRILFGDTKITQWKEAGLIYPSLVTGIVRTLKQNMVIRKLGTLSQEDFQKVKSNFNKSLGF